MTNVCILKTSALGDIIHCYPALAFLKEQGARVTWVVEKRNSELVRRHPLVDRVLIVDTKKGLFNIKALRDTRYDTIYDLQGNIKSGVLLGLMRGRSKVGFQKPAEWPNKLFTRTHIAVPKGQNIREDYLSIVNPENVPFSYQPTLLEISMQDEEIVEEWADKGRILVAPGARWPSKIAPLEMLHPHLESKDLLISWGSDQEKHLAEQLKKMHPSAKLLPKLSLPALQHLMAKMDLVVAMDSLPLHLAGETGVPTLSFFGPSSALKYKPLGDYHTVIQAACAEGRTFEKRCKKIRKCHCLRGSRLSSANDASIQQR